MNKSSSKKAVFANNEAASDAAFLPKVEKKQKKAKAPSVQDIPATQSDNDLIKITVQSNGVAVSFPYSVPRKNSIKEAGAKWNTEGKYWIMDSKEKALAWKAKEEKAISEAIKSFQTSPLKADWLKSSKDSYFVLGYSRLAVQICKDLGGRFHPKQDEVPAYWKISAIEHTNLLALFSALDSSLSR